MGKRKVTFEADFLVSAKPPGVALKQVVGVDRVFGLSEDQIIENVKILVSTYLPRIVAGNNGLSSDNSPPALTEVVIAIHRKEFKSYGQ